MKWLNKFLKKDSVRSDENADQMQSLVEQFILVIAYGQCNQDHLNAIYQYRFVLNGTEKELENLIDVFLDVEFKNTSIRTVNLMGRIGNIDCMKITFNPNRERLLDSVILNDQ